MFLFAITVMVNLIFDVANLLMNLISQYRGSYSLHQSLNRNLQPHLSARLTLPFEELVSSIAQERCTRTAFACLPCVTKYRIPMTFIINLKNKVPCCETRNCLCVLLNKEWSLFLLIIEEMFIIIIAVT